MTNTVSLAKREPSSTEAHGRDPVYRAVMALREPGALESYVRKAWSRISATTPSVLRVTVLQTHYKPWSRARILAEVIAGRDGAHGDRVTQVLFLQIYPSGQQARRRIASGHRKKSLPCIGPPVFLLDAWNTVVWSLPNGPKLRKVRRCFATHEFAELLNEMDLGKHVWPDLPPLPQLVRYVPRRRALFRYVPPDVAASALYIKLYAPGEDVAAARNLALLTRSAERRFLGFHPPRIVAYEPRFRAVVMEEVPGMPLTGLLADPPAAVFATVGRALAGLHGSGLTTTHTWEPELELSALGDALSDVAKALPALAPDLRVLLERLERQRGSLLFDQQTPIHANLFGDQILIDSNSVDSNSVDSNSVAIVDWDDLAMGDPLYDVGRLIAHTIFAARQQGADPARAAQAMKSMLSRYTSEAGRPLAADRLRWHVAMALLMRTKISALRPLPSTWVEDIREGVAEAARILDGQSAWFPNC